MTINERKEEIMPIYIKFDGVDGESPSSGGSAHPSGILVAMGDGSVRFIKNSTNQTSGGGPRVVVFSGSDNVAATINAIEVSRIEFPNSASNAGNRVLDALDADAAVRARELFYAARGFGRTSGIRISVSKKALLRAAAGNAAINDLKQLAPGRHTRIPALELLFSAGGTSRASGLKLENTLITGYQTSGSGDTMRMENYILKFAQLKFR